MPFLREFSFIPSRSNEGKVRMNPESALYFCSGYFNPPETLCSAIQKSQCSVELLSADRRANGFNNARFPKSGITASYQMFADYMLEAMAGKEVEFAEWYREKERVLK